MKKIISIMLSIMIMLMPMISLGTTGHINGCTNTTFDTGCCTKTFRITPQEGYRVIDVIVNGVSQGAITTYTFSNITGPQTLKVVTEAIGGSSSGGTGGTTSGYKVKFNANGGTGSMPSQTFEEGVTQNLNKNTYTKEGYDFAGWSTTVSGSVEYEDEASFSATEEITLYAVWMPSMNTLSVGSYVTYAPPSTKSYTGKWLILKNNEGQLDIVSKESVESIKIGSTSSVDATYRDSVKVLNNKCAEYVNDYYASHARSLGSTYPWNETTVTDGISVGSISKPTYRNEDNFPYTDTLYTSDVDIIN